MRVQKPSPIPGTGRNSERALDAKTPILRSTGFRGATAVKLESVQARGLGSVVDLNLKMVFEILTDKEIEELKERAIRQRNFYAANLLR
jgi:hypothetical protein